jgi:hypothetical protein
LRNALKRLYEELNHALESDPPPEVRRELRQMARSTLRQWVMMEYASDKVRKLIGKISNGFDYWFMVIIHLGMEPTTNRAERALRKHIILISF